MKRMLFFILTGLFLFSFAIFYTTNLAELSFSGKYYLYTVDDDGDFEIETTEDDAKKLFAVNQVVLGEGYQFDNKSITPLEIMTYFDAEIVSECVLDGMKVKNCFSPRLKDYVMQGGERVNLQIAITEDTIKIGYPLILDSF